MVLMTTTLKLIEVTIWMDPDLPYDENVSYAASEFCADLEQLGYYPVLHLKGSADGNS